MVKMVIITLAIISAAASFLVHHHGYFHIDETPAFYAWYAFAACVALISGAKALSAVLMRDEDYYVPEDGSDKGREG